VLSINVPLSFTNEIAPSSSTQDLVAGCASIQKGGEELAMLLLQGLAPLDAQG
jgi:hypothetical protein